MTWTLTIGHARIESGDGRLESLVVQRRLDAPSEARARFVLGHAMDARVGEDVAVKFDGVRVFVGRCTRVDRSLDALDGTRVTVAAWDGLHALGRRDRRDLRTEISDRELVGDWASGVELTPVLSGPNQARPVAMQRGTDRRAFESLARRRGWSWTTDDGRLLLFAPGDGRETTLPGAPGFRRIAIEVNAFPTRDRIAVSAWDGLRRSVWTASASGGDRPRSSAGSATVALGDRPAFGYADAAALAGALGAKAAWSWLRGYAEVDLLPELRPGDRLRLPSGLAPPAVWARARVVEHRVGGGRPAGTRIELDGAPPPEGVR